MTLDHFSPEHINRAQALLSELERRLEKPLAEITEKDLPPLFCKLSVSYSPISSCCYRCQRWGEDVAGGDVQLEYLSSA
jgi:hypothetical protein